MKMVGTLAELMVKNKPKVLPTVCNTGESQGSALSMITESPLWHDEEHTVILQETSIGTMRDGI
jgi:hypothetical protein